MLERGVRVPIEIPLDEHGHMDRRCPSAECKSEFKVLFADWRDKVRDDVVYCPICRHEAVSTEWNTPSQEEHIKRVALAHLQKVVNTAMREDARHFNARQPRGGLISMSMSVRPGARPILMPPQAAEAMRQAFDCETCGCRYSSLGAAFFCPACGHNSAQSTFASAVETVRASVDNLPAIRDAVTAVAGKESAADTARDMVENGLVKLVAAFQRFAEATFHTKAGSSTIKARKNVFQNLGESTKLWKDATGKGYEDILSAGEIAELGLHFQQRHLLAHREGMVDQEYLGKSNDRNYSVGQRLVIKEASVLRLAELVEKLAGHLKALP